MVFVMRRIPLPVRVALGFLVAMVLLLSIVNGGNHVPYFIGIWTVITVIGLVVYYSARAVTLRVRR
jgi:hypothetical protein